MSPTTIGGDDRPGHCPSCFGPTTVTIPGHARCRACGWQGKQGATKEQDAGSLELSEIRFHRGTRADQRGGLLGYLTFVLNGALRIDGVALREKADGQLTLSYPARRDRYGQDHPNICPIDDATRRLIERRVFAELPRLMRGEG